MGQNLLVNGSFEDGYYHKDGVPELAIPNHWEFWYAPAPTPYVYRQDSDWFPPETVVWNINDAPLDERDIFFLSGAYCLKVFKGWGPIWWQLSQTVNGLTLGARYRFSVPIHPDLVMAKSGAQKIYADDMLAGEHVIQVNSGASVFESGWQDGEKVPFGTYTTLALNFTAAAESAVCSVECRGRWGLLNNGWFLDALTLERIDNAPLPDPVAFPVPPAPTASPTPASRLFGVFVIEVTDNNAGYIELTDAIRQALAAVGRVVWPKGIPNG